MEIESTPNRKPSSPEERKKRIAELQGELQSMSQDDTSRGEKLKELISLTEEDEVLEKGEITVPDDAYATNTKLPGGTATSISAPVDMTPPDQPFAQVKQDSEQK